MDALNALREAVVYKLEIRREGGNLVLGGRPYPLQTTTPFWNRTGGHHVLGTLWLQWELRDRPTAEYVERSNQEGLPMALVIEKDLIVKYLEGRSAGDRVIDRAMAMSVGAAEGGGAWGAMPLGPESAATGEPSIAPLLVAEMASRAPAGVDREAVEAAARCGFVVPREAVVRASDGSGAAAFVAPARAALGFGRGSRGAPADDYPLPPHALTDASVLLALPGAEARVLARRAARDPGFVSSLSFLPRRRVSDDALVTPREPPAAGDPLDGGGRAAAGAVVDEVSLLVALASARELVPRTRITAQSAYQRDFAALIKSSREQLKVRRLEDRRALAAAKQASLKRPMTVWEKEREEAEKAMKGEGSGSAASAAAAVPRAPSAGGARLPWTPIIVVPANARSLINIWNASSFLTESRWEDPEVVRQRTNTPAPWQIRIRRQTTGAEVPEFHVVNSVSSLQPAHYDRIVAIIADGTDWQFLNWRWGRPVGMPDLTPAEIFSRCPGFHVFFESTDLPPTILRWNVKRLPISRAHRHSDERAVAAFWSTVDDFIRRQKPDLIASLAASIPRSSDAASAAALLDHTDA